MTEEKKIFRQGDIIISSSSFTFGGRTFAANNITAVSWKKSKGKKLFGILMLVFGVILMLLTITHFGANAVSLPIGVKLLYSTGYLIRYYISLGIGITAVISGLLVLILIKEKYVLILTSSGVKQKTLVHRDKDILIQIANAMNEAIIHNHQK
jgi:uncharacterized membrane protein